MPNTWLLFPHLIFTMTQGVWRFCIPTLQLRNSKAQRAEVRSQVIQPVSWQSQWGTPDLNQCRVHSDAPKTATPETRGRQPRAPMLGRHTRPGWSMTAFACPTADLLINPARSHLPCLLHIRWDVHMTSGTLLLMIDYKTHSHNMVTEFMRKFLGQKLVGILNSLSQ